jgi:hypothetical protein
MENITISSRQNTDNNYQTKIFERNLDTSFTAPKIFYQDRLGCNYQRQFAENKTENTEEIQSKKEHFLRGKPILGHRLPIINTKIDIQSYQNNQNNQNNQNSLQQAATDLPTNIYHNFSASTRVSKKIETNYDFSKRNLKF